MKTIKYKVWLTIEEMFLDDDNVEQHRDTDGMPHKYGEYYTLEEAEKVVESLEEQGGFLPDVTPDGKIDLDDNPHLESEGRTFRAMEGGTDGG